VPAEDAASVSAPATVTVSVLYFAALRDLSGRAEETVSVVASSHVDVDALLVALERRHDPLRGRLASVRVAVNEEFVVRSTELRGGEVVALIPPVSGG
jgi:molybdopterin synthase sulfur carrier subunit